MSPLSWRFFPFGHREPRLFLGNVGPLLVEFQVGQCQAAHLGIQEPLAGIAEVDDQFANRVAVACR